MNNISEKIYYIMNYVSHRRKEKLDLIVEPLQACFMIALLNYLPKGTKIAIQNNVLNLQIPSIIQGIERWYNNDNKDDIQFLVVIVKRYMNFYKNENNQLFSYLNVMINKGLDKLIETYIDNEKQSIIQTLRICKLLVNNDEFVTENVMEKKEIDQILINIKNIYDDNFYNLLYYYLLLLEKDTININNYFYSINYLYYPFHNKIKNWISRNISN